MRRVSGSNLLPIILILGLVSCQVPKKQFKCSLRDIELEASDCYNIFPNCEMYEYQQDAANPGKYIYDCAKCYTGYKPTAPISNLPKEDFRDTPDVSKMSSKSLKVCEFDTDFKESIPCIHDKCQSIFPNCQLLKIISTGGTPSNQTVQFECAECHPLFKPNPKSSELILQLSKLETLQVCLRKEGQFECGMRCQSEFPGCKRYSIRSVKTSYQKDVGYSQTGIFYCNESYEGYNALNFEFTMNSDIALKDKALTIRQYQPSLMDCRNNVFCKRVFPNCKEYYSIGVELGSVQHFCKTCLPGYAPKTAEAIGVDMINMYFKNQIENLCEAVESNKIACNNDCKLEFPGCNAVSIKNPHLLNDHIQVAHYKCDECATDYEPLNNDYDTPVWIGLIASFNVKLRCLPKQIKTPTICDDKCKKKYPRCNKYTAMLNPDLTRNVFEFKCTECEVGFEPRAESDVEPWYLTNEKSVCKRTPIPTPTPCDQNCKTMFPYCDEVQVTKLETTNHTVYQCTKCAAGYYPLQYEDEVAGKISNVDHFMKDSSQIHLCSNTPNEVYLSRDACDIDDPRTSEYDGCVSNKNCLSAVLAKRIDRYGRYFKCLQCADGYQLKKIVPFEYDLDASPCEKIPQAAA